MREPLTVDEVCRLFGFETEPWLVRSIERSVQANEAYQREVREVNRRIIGDAQRRVIAGLRADGFFEDEIVEWTGN